MEKRYRYEFDLWGNWERFIDTTTGKVLEGYRLNLEDVFSQLGIKEQVEMVVKLYY